MSDETVRGVYHCKAQPDPNGVYIGRPGPYGNPFQLEDAKDDAARADVIARHAAWVRGQPHYQRFIRRTLAGKRLGCWCAPRPCHGDILHAIAGDGGPTKEPVLVFGSNVQGIHGRGAALDAVRFHGAIRGVGEGPQGNAYGVPTRTMVNGQLVTLPPDDVRAGIWRFLDYAAGHPEQSFRITRLGCGLAGLDELDVWAWFQDGRKLPNLEWPGIWRVDAKTGRLPVRVVIAGSSTFDTRNPAAIEWGLAELDRLMAPFMARAQNGEAGWPTPVSGGAIGVDDLGERWAVTRLGHLAVPFERWPADWQNPSLKAIGQRTRGDGTPYAPIAGMVRNTDMAWSATHLLAFWDGQSPGTRNMIDLGKNFNLRVHCTTIPSTFIRPNRRPGASAARRG